MKLESLNKDSLVFLIKNILKEYPQLNYQLNEMFKEVYKDTQL